MNPWLIVAFLLSILGAGAGGFTLGADHEVAAKSREDKHIAAAVEAATKTSAEAIAAIRPKYTTIQNEVQREIRTNTVFADCKLPVDSLRLVNQALNAGAVAPGDSKLPKADAPK